MLNCFDTLIRIQLVPLHRVARVRGGWGLRGRGRHGLLLRRQLRQHEQAEVELLPVGPDRQCSPPHEILFDSRNVGLQCGEWSTSCNSNTTDGMKVDIVEDDVTRIILQALTTGAGTVRR
jgi:hypothetical protein